MHQESNMQPSDSSYVFLDYRNRNIEARLSCSFQKRGKWYFANCRELELVDQGLTQKEAFENLLQMISSVILDAVDTGKIEAVLKEYGTRNMKLQLSI
jgi:hypothetical protein